MAEAPLTSRCHAKVSRGSQDKPLVECKLAKNSHLESNLQRQAEIYQKASDAQHAIKVILYFSAGQRKRVEGIVKKLKLAGHEYIVLIDEKTTSRRGPRRRNQRRILSTAIADENHTGKPYLQNYLQPFFMQALECPHLIDSIGWGG